MATTSTGARAESGATAARLLTAIARVSRRLRQQAGDELSPSRAAVLATVDRDGPITPSELAAQEQISRPTITRLAARLADQGLVRFVPDPLDGRSHKIETTEEARELLTRRRTQKGAYLERLLSNAAPSELELLGRAADTLLRLLAEES